MENVATTSRRPTRTPSCSSRRPASGRATECACESSRPRAVVGGSFVAAATIMAALLQWQRGASAPALVVSVLAYVAASTISFEVGDGYAAPTQIVFVAMLFVLPPTASAGGGGGLASHHARGRRHPGRQAPVARPARTRGLLVLARSRPRAVARRGRPARVVGLADYVGALAAQFAVDVVWSTSGPRRHRACRPRTMLRVLGWVYGVDAALAPIGLAIGFAAGERPYLTCSACRFSGCSPTSPGSARRASTTPSS